jgi:predicted  nucleic acid-binding Zn-ribbon protein
MNKEILTMIDLQKHMDEILLCKNHIKDEQEKLTLLKNECTSCERLVVSAEEKLMSIKASIKAHELDLSGADGRKIKLETRKYTLTSEREVEAVNREINAVVSLIGQYEETLISLMDENDICDKNIAQLKQEYSSKQAVFDRVQADTGQKIKEWTASEDSHRTQYDILIKNLDQRVQPKFSKLISGKPFKAIAEVNNNACGACNYNIPASLAYEAMKDETLTLCTNCGRFIYCRVNEIQE